MTKMLIATKNKGKLAEFTALLAGFGVEIYTLSNFPGIPPANENGETFLENALIKARAGCSYSDLPTLADDSGLMVDALDGKPGVYSARLAFTEEGRNAKLLELLQDIPDLKRTAHFVCALAFVRPDGFEWTTESKVDGVILRAPHGKAGFGYDPLFLYPQRLMTFAEIPIEEKNKFSHRAKALAEFRNAVSDEGILKL